MIIPILQTNAAKRNERVIKPISYGFLPLWLGLFLATLMLMLSPPTFASSAVQVTSINASSFPQSAKSVHTSPFLAPAKAFRFNPCLTLFQQNLGFL